MRTYPGHSIHKVLAKILFIVLPTVAVLYHLLQYWNVSFEIPTTDLVRQTGYFGIGCIGAVLFYALGFRFIPTFIILAAGLYFLYKGIDATAIGEFDTFFLTVRFAVFAVLFTAGWLTGWAILRVRKAGIILSVLFMMLYVFHLGEDEIWLQQHTQNEVWLLLLKGLAPIFFYAVIAIYFSEFINHLDTTPRQFWTALAKRSILLSGLVFLLFLLTSKNSFLNFEQRFVELAGSDADGKTHNMLKKEQGTNGREGGYSLNDKLSMAGSNQKENVLMFTAHIDNFFDDRTTPNPLYLVSFYYTRYDTRTETFERDSVTPDKDYFSPDVSRIPMYHILQDTSVLAYGRKDAYKSEVAFEIYNKNLTPGFFVGPATAFFVQPIAVEPSFRTEYTNAYRGKSLSSDLNSAYFVYNVDDPVIRTFQTIRTKKLQSYTDYSGVDTAFMRYYTDMPQSDVFRRVDSLAHAVTAHKKSNIDKVIAIRDFFLERDAKGKKLFRYTDNPGEPDLPGSSKLAYFLFESRKGYCAYYATATLYMLRSLGIPSRVVGGFLTEDRSADKNRGWYWYYADQAHAWVQVYFPGIGWIDFDTTIDNEDARESNQTDGTPPLQPAKATFASFGIFTEVDTLLKKGVFQITSLVIMDKPMAVDPMKVTVDLSIATVRKDTAALPLSHIIPGDSATIVSYARVFEKIAQADKHNIQKQLPEPLPVDEVHLMVKQDKTPPPLPEADQQLQKLKNTIVWVLAALCLLLLIVFSLPYLVYLLLKSRLKNATGSRAVVTGYKLQRWVNLLFTDQAHKTDKMLFEAADRQYGIRSSAVLASYHAYKYGQQLPADTDSFKQLVYSNITGIQKQVKASRRPARWLQVQKLLK